MSHATDWPAMLPDVARRLLADRPCRELGGDKANSAGKVGAGATSTAQGAGAA